MRRSDPKSCAIHLLLLENVSCLSQQLAMCAFGYPLVPSELACWRSAASLTLYTPQA